MGTQFSRNITHRNHPPLFTHSLLWSQQSTEYFLASLPHQWKEGTGNIALQTTLQLHWTLRANIWANSIFMKDLFYSYYFTFLFPVTVTYSEHCREVEKIDKVWRNKLNNIPTTQNNYANSIINFFQVHFTWFIKFWI